MKTKQTTRLSLLITKAVYFSCFLFLFSAAALHFTGCGDDTVSTNYNIDMPRFNWKTVSLNAENFNCIWSRDTANMYLMSNVGNKLFKLTNGSLTNYNIGNHLIKQLSGNTSNVVIFALDESGEMKFVIWNGAAQEIRTGIYIPDTLGNYFTGCATDDMGYWIASQSGIASYNGGSTTRYYVNDNMFIPKHIYKSRQNTIRITGESRNTQKIYELQDTAFVQIFENTGNYYLKVLRDEAYGYFINENIPGPCFYNISGNSYVENFCINTNIPISFGNSLSGTAFSDLFFEVYSSALFNELSSFGILHWDGYKFSREFEFEVQQPGIGNSATAFYSIDENNLLILEGQYPSKKLYIGTRK
ncbi:MAG TPA: hypothetical protein PK753_13515 [Ignavibacteria bacterium]|nr:hypothetical protein [Ignavibacteria bacterium]HRJ86685.1 hypothetical protein [Ignavibacteria bacterium]